MTLRPEMSDISIVNLFLHCLLSLIRYKKHQLPYPHVKWSLRTHVTFRGSIVIEFMDCRLFIDFTVESAETGWKRENVFPHVSLPHCTWPPYSPDRAPFLLPSWTSATSSRPVLVSHCHCANLSPRQKAGLGEEETHDKDTNVTKNK